jgi:streptomycin 6-kinase
MPVSVQLIERAERLMHELLASAPRVIVLHGDLHQANILRSVRAGWIAIDPKGRIGEPAYEAAALLRNPRSHLLAHPNPRQLLTRRIDLLTETLQIERSRLLAWAFILAVTAAIWQIEDHEDEWEGWIRIAGDFIAIERG